MRTLIGRNTRVFGRLSGPIGARCVVAVACGVLGACASEQPRTPRSALGVASESTGYGVDQPVIDLTAPGAVGRGTAAATTLDTRAFDPQVQVALPWDGPTHRVKEVLPAHSRQKSRAVADEPNGLEAGGVMSAGRTIPGARFPGITQTPWVPPDPTLAVGPDHVVETVNMVIAFYTKDGTLQFSANLDSTGNPGFFEDVGGKTFVFDPKCFYDHGSGRFVIVALEVYGNSDEAYIDIAVSDDSDPNGVWYKYRTDAKIQVGNNTYWVDYPGVGYDDGAFYVTGNLFGLNNGGYGGAVFRVFTKAPLLDGSDARFSDLRDPNGYTAQSAQQFGASPAPYFVTVESSTKIKVQAIRDPLGTPSLVQTTVAVPFFGDPPGAPNVGGTIDLFGSSIYNAHWRDGRLYATHHIGSGGKSVVRWYEFATGAWPDAGSVTLTQSGNIDGGQGVYTFYPAIYSNKFHDVGVVMGSSSAQQTPQVSVAGRRAADAPGMMGAVTSIKSSGQGAAGRWGDYYDIAVDPVDDTTFWVVGQHSEGFGWATWIGHFRVACPPDCTGEGTLDLFDFLCFQNQFAALDPEADCTGDGAWDLFDFLCFVNLFNEGC